ncbi:MAG: flippase-like domain-containing protein [Chloroflexi bacterium]|nr:flippase-like domain-containing protein [Chloroflexota bacterium]
MRRLITSRAVRLVVGVAISAAFLAATLRQVDVAAALRLLFEAQPAWILVSIGLVATEVMLRGARWRLLLRPFRPVPLRYATGYLCVGYFANTLLPARLGDLARASLAGRTLGIPQLATLGTIVVERLADGITILVLVIGCGLIVTGASALVGTAVMLALAGAAALATVLAIGLMARILRLHETRHGEALVGFLRRIAIGATALRRPATLGAVLALTLAAFGLAVVSFLATSTAVGISISPLEAAVVMGGLALSTAIPAAPGAIGTYEFVGVAILTSFGVAPEAALATVLLTHAIALLVPSTAGLVTTWVLHFNVREVANAAPADPPGVQLAR